MFTTHEVMLILMDAIQELRECKPERDTISILEELLRAFEDETIAIEKSVVVSTFERWLT